MDSEQIYRIMTDYAYENEFLGVFARDNIPLRSMHYPCGLIINTMPHNHNGEHWVAIYKDEYNKGFYFDSFGRNPHFDEFYDCLNFCDDWSYNKQQFQSIFTDVCGQYAIFFLLHKMHGYNSEEITHLIQNNCYTSNDLYMFNFVRLLTPSQTPNIFPFSFKQISKIVS